MSLREASSYFGEMFALKYEAKRTREGRREGEKKGGGMKREEEMRGGMGNAGRGRVI